MVKPTLLQSLLGRPSQSYAFSADKDFYSSKKEFRRAAALSQGEAGAGHPRPSARLAQDPPDTGIRLEHTRTRLIGTSLSGNNVIQPSLGLNCSPPPVLSPPVPPDNQTDIGYSDDTDGDDEDDEDDVFYTPLSSPPSSPPLSMLVDSPAISSLLTPPQNLPHHVYDKSTSSDSSVDSGVSVSTVPTSDETHSALSATASSSKSTNITTPSMTSDKLPGQNHHPSGLASSSRSCNSPTRTLHSTRRPSSSQPHSKTITYTDEDWAKDVRWLVSPSAATVKSPKQKRRQSLPVTPTYYADLPSVLPQPYLPSRRGRPKSGRMRAKDLMTALMEEDETASEDYDYDSHVTHPDPEPPLALPSSSRNRIRIVSDGSGNPIVSNNNSGSSGLGRNGSLSPSTSLTSRNTTASASSSTTTRSPYTISSGTVTLPTPLPIPPPPTSASHTSSVLGETNLGVTATPGTSGYTTLTLPRAAYKPADPWRTLGGGRIDLAREGKAQTTMVSIEIVRGVADALPSGPRGLLRRSTNSRRSSLAGISFHVGSSSKTSLALGADGEGKKRSGKSKASAFMYSSLSSALALTSHLPPPSYCPASHVLIQVYAVGLEGLDAQIVAEKVGRNGGFRSGGAGFVPGRSVVGRVVECGWEVRGDVMRKGEWVIGLLDVKKCGALAEFIVLERHRVHRAPQPNLPSPSLFPTSHPLPSLSPGSPGMTLESLALLAMVGVPAYRAVRTYLVSRSATSGPRKSGRALVLRGQDSVGGMATLMLAANGVGVVVHVEPSIVGVPKSETPLVMLSSTEDEVNRGKKHANPQLEDLYRRVCAWGAEGICVGSTLDTLTMLDEREEVFDFVLDTTGGNDVWERAHRLLSRPSICAGGVGEDADAQFTTVVGDTSSGRAVPSAHDHWRAGVRSLKRAMSSHSTSGTSSPASATVSVSPSSSSSDQQTTTRERKSKKRVKPRTVGYSWVSCVADVDFEGRDVRDTLGVLVEMLERGTVSPEDMLLCSAEEGDEGAEGVYGAGRVLAFERAPEAFGKKGLLEGGGTVVVRVVV